MSRPRSLPGRSAVIRLLTVASVLVLIASSTPRAGGAGADPPQLLVAGEVADPSIGVNHLVLIWDEILDTSSLPAPSDFVVSVNGTDYAGTSLVHIYSGFAGEGGLVGPDGTTMLRLGLPVSVTSQDALSIDYTPGTNPIRDRALVEAAPIVEGQAGVFVPDGFAFVGGAIDSGIGADRIVMFFTRPLTTTSIPTGSDFAVTVNGVPATVTAVAPLRTDVRVGTLDLRLDTAARSGDDVRLAYTPGTSPIKDNFGNPLDPFFDHIVTLFLPVDSVSQTVVAGQEVTTSTIAPTASDPVSTSITPSAGGTVSITEGASSGGTSVYDFFGQQIDITAPAAPSGSQPLIIRFGIDATLVPPGETATTVQVFRNGALVPACGGTPGTVDPTPACVSQREALADGDIGLTILATQASTWNFGVVAPLAFDGLYAPVDNYPTVNSMTAGRSVPIKFSLGGDLGTGILQSGSPTSRPVPCADELVPDVVEQTVTAGASTLSYDPRTDTYTYVWKTDRAWTGTCRELVVILVDGTTVTALFEFTR